MVKTAIANLPIKDIRRSEDGTTEFTARCDYYSPAMSHDNLGLLEVEAKIYDFDKQQPFLYDLARAKTVRVIIEIDEPA